MDIRLKILEDREKRLQIISEKLKETNNLFVTVKCNICGNDKNIKETNILLEYFKNILVANFEIIHIEKYNSYDGNFYLAEIGLSQRVGVRFDDNLNSTEEGLEESYVDIKRKLIEIENSQLGRFIDLDLFNGGEKSVSRADLMVPFRKCIICHKAINICTREKQHTFDEIFDATVNGIRGEFVESLVFIITQSLKEEVTAHPKFGLVTKVNSGKHKDMDYNTFIESIEVLKPYFAEYAFEGFDFGEATFGKLRKIGVRAEKALLEKTKGVNTYKGVIFLLGILIPSIVDVVYNNKIFEEIQENIKYLSVDILKDFDNLDEKIKNNETLTYGEKIYKEYGITGVRGEVKNGLEIAFELAKQFRNPMENNNDLVINILLNSMAQLDDTVILHKHSIETLSYIKNRSYDIIKHGDIDSDIWRSNIEKFTEECIELNISPGGSADIVSVVLILIKIRQMFY